MAFVQVAWRKVGIPVRAFTGIPSSESFAHQQIVALSRGWLRWELFRLLQTRPAIQKMSHDDV